MAKRKEAVSREPEPDDDEDDGFSPRDFVMARLAASRASLQAAMEAVDECVACFVNPDEDKGGKERQDLVDAALEAVGCASRGLEAADEMLEEGDVDFDEPEPWDDEEE